MRTIAAAGLMLIAGCSSDASRLRPPEVPRDGRGDALLLEIRPVDGSQPATPTRKKQSCLHLRRC
ncbi:hypothetical protein [Glacieibacterium sp.]|uniref:hypothetical protein n=1 Tax=Glacieibacterium sp. TaxID=2860237 RepID=UPI003AFFD27D